MYAFRNGMNMKQDNTRVVSTNGNSKMYLHGNLIAERTNNRLFISACGWLTNTTKERLNAINGVNIYQKNFVWYLNSFPWDGSRIEVK